MMKPEQPAPKKSYAPKKPRQKTFLKTAQALFLEQFTVMPSVKAAAEASRIERTAHYRWLREDPEYRREWEAIQEQAGQACEDEAVRRAMEGVKKPILYKGKPVHVGKGRGSRILYETDYSDALLILMLKRYKPNLYREHVTAEVTGSIDIVERLNAGRQRVLAMRKEEQAG